jgi:hypothetical protein
MQLLAMWLTKLIGGSFPPQDGDFDPQAEKDAPGSRALYHMAVVAEHQAIAENFEELNAQEHPWMWLLAHDQEILMSRLSGVYKDKLSP